MIIKSILERFGWADSFNYSIHSNPKEHPLEKYSKGYFIYEVKGESLRETLLLRDCYNINKEVNCLDDFYLDIPKKDELNNERLKYKQKVFVECNYKYNVFPKTILNLYGKPTLPKKYIHMFGEFYNFKYLTQFLLIEEFNKIPNLFKVIYDRTEAKTYVLLYKKLTKESKNKVKELKLKRVKNKIKHKR